MNKTKYLEHTTDISLHAESQGNKYWRFDGDVLDEDYPRDISVGFEKIPDDIDAAFAIPAPGHHGREKVYFFKGMGKSNKGHNRFLQG